MSILCAKENCNKAINKRNDLQLSISCKVCNQFFHGKCVGLSSLCEIQLVKNGEHSNWTCDSCRSIRRQSSSFDNLTVSGHAVTTSPLNVVQPENLDSTSFATLIKKIDNLELALNARFDAISVSVDQINRIMEENSKLKLKIVELEKQVTIMQDELMGHSIDIVNVPLSQNDSVDNVVLTVIQTGLEISINRMDIERCYQVFTNRVNNKSKIVVKLKTATMKKAILDKIKTKKAIPSQIITPASINRIYINESLPYYKRHLLKEAAKIKADGHFKYLWTRDGKIMTRRKEGDKIIYIKSTEDLHKLLLT